MSRYYDTRLKISRFRREPLIRLKVRRGLPLGERIPFARLSFWDRTRRNSGRRVREIFFFKDDRNLRRKDIARRRFKCTTACFRLPQPRLKFSGSAALHTSCTGPPQARESCLCQLASSGVVLERNGNEQSHRDGSGTESRAFSYGGSFCKSRLQEAIVRLVVYPSSNIFVGDICYSWRFSRNEPHKKIQEFLGWNCSKS